MNLTRRTLEEAQADDPSAGPLMRTRAGKRRLIRWQVALSACFFVVTAVLVKVIVSEARNDLRSRSSVCQVSTLHFGVQGWDETRARRAIGRALESA